MNETKLPPMPPNYHGWWKHQKTERIELKPQKPCSHLKNNGDTAFLVKGDEVECSICHLGFTGEGFEIRDGRLHNGRLSAHIK